MFRRKPASLRVFRRYATRTRTHAQARARMYEHKPVTAKRT
jgi:hypothetical protein